MPTTQMNGVSLFYTDRGSGIPILFVHPPLLSHLNFLYQLEGLSSSFRTIALDIRGHGRSEPSIQAITYPLIAADIRALMDELALERCFLCGYSLGGSIVLDFLLTYPQRAAGAVLIGAIPEILDLRLRQALRLAVALSRPPAFHWLASVISRTSADTPQLFRALLEDARRADPRNVGQYYRCALSFNCTARLPLIQHPVLLVLGEKDKTFHRYGALLRSRLPHAQLVMIPRVKHQVPTRGSRDLNRHITRFVHQHAQRPLLERQGEPWVGDWLSAFEEKAGDQPSLSSPE